MFALGSTILKKYALESHC